MRLLLAALLALPLAAAAQSTPAVSDSTNALVFGFNGLNLGEYDGGLGYLVRLSPESSLLLGIDGRYQRSSDESVFEGGEDESTRTNGSVRLRADLRRYLSPMARVSPYAQVGAFSGIEWYTNENVRVREGEEMRNASENADLLLGGVAGFGVAYRLSGTFELSGAYLLSATYQTDLTSSSSQDGEEDEREYDRSRWLFDLGATRLTLAVYF